MIKLFIIPLFKDLWDDFKFFMPYSAMALVSGSTIIIVVITIILFIKKTF
jgi:hypothetical protein